MRAARLPVIQHTAVVLFPTDGSPPSVGLYRAKLAQGAALVPVALFWECPWVNPAFDADPEDWCRPLDRGRRLRWVVAGKDEAIPDHWFPMTGERLATADYELLAAQALWDRAHRPNAPMANPRKRVSLDEIEIPF